MTTAKASDGFQVWWPRLAPLRQTKRRHARVGTGTRPEARSVMRPGVRAVTRPGAHDVVTSVSSNVTQRSLSEIDTRILQLERQLAEIDSEGQLSEIDSANLQRSSARKDRQAVAAASTKRARDNVDSAAPVDDVAGLSLHCDICGVGVTSQALMREHLQGRKHRDAARTRLAASEGRFCDTCSLAFTSAAQLKEHCNGKSHKSRLAAGQSGGAGKGAAAIRNSNGAGRGGGW